MNNVTGRGERRQRARTHKCEVFARMRKQRPKQQGGARPPCCYFRSPRTATAKLVLLGSAFSRSGRSGFCRCSRSGFCRSSR
ncbi:conserved hypothetical protein, partial [Ricinus communis]